MAQCLVEHGSSTFFLLMNAWRRLPPNDPSLFKRLRDLPPANVTVRFRIGVEERGRVEVPAASLTLQGRLRVEPVVDRFEVEIPGWGTEDFAWFARRKGRGRTDYWQAAIEHKPEGRPALVLYLTAPLDGLEISVQETPLTESSEQQA